MKIKCPYCSKEAQLVTGYDLYPHMENLFSKKFYKCFSCDAYVGCHPNSEKPLGTLANKELRKMRSICHREFDILWKNNKMSRSEAYELLGKIMKLGPVDAHIGMFNMKQCRHLLEYLESSNLVKI